MSKDASRKGDYLTPKDVEQWVRQEIADSAKAHELRTKELADLAKSYSAAEISPKEADELHSRYYKRWGDALPSISTGPGVTDEQILKALDEAAEGRSVRVAARSETRGR